MTDSIQPPFKHCSFPLRVLFVDDDERRHVMAKKREHDFVHVTYVYDYKQACEALLATQFDLVLLDHDLFYKTIDHTGYDIALFIVDLPKDQRPKEIHIHSHNETGRQRMARLLVDNGFTVKIFPFIEDDK